MIRRLRGFMSSSRCVKIIFLIFSARGIRLSHLHPVMILCANATIEYLQTVMKAILDRFYSKLLKKLPRCLARPRTAARDQNEIPKYGNNNY